MIRNLAPAVVAVSALAGIAGADVEVEFGGTAGLRVFSDTNGFGVDDGPAADSQKNSALFGLRLGVYGWSHLGAELEVGTIPGEGRSMLFNVWNLTYRASLVAQLPITDHFVPFALIGGGLHTIVWSEETDRIGTDTRAVPHAGLGAKYGLDTRLGLRIDARILLPPSSAGSGVTADFEVLASIYRAFGGAPAKPPAAKQRDL